MSEHQSIHHPEVTMKTQLQTSYVKLTALLAVAVPLDAVMGATVKLK